MLTLPSWASSLQNCEKNKCLFLSQQFRAFCHVCLRYHNLQIPLQMRGVLCTRPISEPPSLPSPRADPHHPAHSGLAQSYAPSRGEDHVEWSMPGARGQEPGLDSDSSEGFPTGWPRPLLRQFSFSSAWGYSPHSPKRGVAFRTPYSVPSVQTCVWGHLPGTPPNTANI